MILTIFYIPMLAFNILMWVEIGKPLWKYMALGWVICFGLTVTGMFKIWRYIS